MRAAALAILSAAISACTAMGIVPVLGYPAPTAALPAARPTLTVALAADIPGHAQIVAALQKAFGKSFALEPIDFPNPPAEVPDLHDVEDRRIEALVDLVGARVLEVGCGEGRLTAFAAARAREVYAFDPSAERVEKARAVADSERVRFGVHRAEALDVERESFDVALCGWSI